MRKEYDFSKGKRGKFYCKNAKINLPIYLDEDNLSFIRKIAKKRNADLTSVVNDLIKGDKELAKAIG